MASATKVLDRNRFEARARIGDILCLGLLVVIGFSLLADMYRLGYSASRAVDGGLSVIFERDALFARLFVQVGIVGAALSWIAFRLLSASARRVGG